MNIIEDTIALFSPITALKRRQAKNALEFSRNYEIASKSRRTDGWFRPSTSGAQEAQKGYQIGANSAQELCRNNPLARRIKKVIASNMVGAGIQLEATANTPKRAEKFNTDWDEWAESVDCDFEGHHTLYGLQNLWAETVVESGGVFIRQHVNKNKKFPLQLQTMEQSVLDRSKSGFTDKGTIIDGIVYDGNGQVEGYWFISEQTNTLLAKPPKSKFHKASNIIHIFKKDRAGQHLGVTWFHAVATTLKQYDTFMDAKIMQQQIAACFALIIEGAEASVGINGGKGTADFPDAIEPAMIEHVAQGQTVTTVTPPRADASASFEVSIKRDVSVGVDITYEQLTGDYSQVNFASGRMGKTEFFTQLDNHQKNMMQPALNKIFNWFVALYEVGTMQSGKYKPDWTFPPRAAVNPQEEFDTLMAKVRHGMMSPTKAAKTLGEKLPTILAQWTKDKEAFKDLKFDIDPSIFASTGNQLDSNDAASQNNESNQPKKKKTTAEEKEKKKTKEKGNGE